MRAMGMIWAVVFAAVAGQASAATALRFGELWDGHRVVRDAVVVVEGDKVVSVAAHGAIPAGAKVVDLSRYSAIPGMIDAHTQMTYVWNPAFGETPLKQKIPPGARVFLAQGNAMRTLE